ncbi:MAG: T9SS type A sorting domain-containing protein [Ignavibacteria bacterium]|nr:T9SS type A sorting domain-containing protein [Ignavibacteria bacterium]
MKKTLIKLLLIFLIGNCFSQNRYYFLVGIGPNFRIFPSTITSQSETDIVSHPFNPNIMFASAITINSLTGFKSEGVYVTTNGGLNWFGSDTCYGNPIFNHGGDPGPAIDKDGRFFLSHIGTFITGMFCHYSTNNGLNWSNAATIASGDMDKGDITSDAVPSSPFFGRTYISYIAFTPPYRVFLAYTTNGGVSWVSGIPINNPPQRCQGSEVKTDLNGNVLVTWASTIPLSPFTEDFVGFAKSTNGGANWIVNENIYDMNGIQGILTQKRNIRVNGLPRMDVDLTNGPRSGWIYIITTEKNLPPAGNDPDIIMHRSTDGGNTWSNGIRVNQDPLNNGKIQYFPAIRVDDQGGINIVYYDDRRTSSDSAEVFLSRSTDGGNTWTDYPISDHRFAPKPISGGAVGYQGDNIGVTSVNNFLWPLWMDDYSGIYQAWTVKIDLNSIGIKKINSATSSEYSLSQNYPNPFNSSTTIEFSIPENDLITIKIYDITGKEISTLINQSITAGKYSLQFSLHSELASGVYYYRMFSDKISITKSMVLIK